MKNILLIALLCFAFSTVFGWGQTGHRATGYIAEQYLNAKAKKRIAEILQGETVAMASTWMDEVRSDSLYDNLIDWHYTTVPDGKRYEDVASSPDGKLIMMIEKVQAELLGRKLNPKQEREYLKILIHLIGDVHQPLHVGKVGDKGAGDVKVKWFGRDSNLHRVWDSEMIDDSKLSYTELAQSLVKPDALVVAKWQKAKVTEWAAEDTGYRAQIYDIGNGGLGYQYTYRNFNLVKLRILQGGIRLGAVLNQIYGK